MTSLATRLIAGAPERKTRLHAQTGEMVSLSRLVRNGPRALATGIGRLLFDWHPRRPWISYGAQQIIERHLAPHSRVLEFGSGASTRWYAERAGRVVSIEHNSEWFAQVRATLPGNVSLRHAQTREDYLLFPEEPYDLVMIDGRWRNRCVAAALPFVAPGGILYLDNSDRPQYADGVRLIEAYAQEHGGEVRRFVDFAPSQLFVQEGAMLILPGATTGAG